MSDLLKLAAQRRDRLQKEVDRLNAFIALGETISREEKPLPTAGTSGPGAGSSDPGPSSGPQRLVNNG